MKVKSLSRVRLLATPWTAAYQAPLSMGFSRQECWSGLPLPSPQLPIRRNCPPVFQRLNRFTSPSAASEDGTPSSTTLVSHFNCSHLSRYEGVARCGFNQIDTADGDVKWFSLWKTGGQFLKRINVE